MTTKELEDSMGRDTTMCGDPKTWFPMRETYQREMKVQAELDRLGIENFVPMIPRALICSVIRLFANRAMFVAIVDILLKRII